MAEERHAGFLASRKTAPVAREAHKSHHIIVTPQSERLTCWASQQVSGQLPAAWAHFMFTQTTIFMLPQ